MATKSAVRAIDTSCGAAYLIHALPGLWLIQYPGYDEPSDQYATNERDARRLVDEWLATRLPIRPS